MRVFISTTSFARISKKPLELLETYNINFAVNKRGRKLTEAELVEALKGIDGVIAGTEKYSAKVLGRVPELKVISRLGVGLDNIDLEYAKRKNIKICKTETTPAPAVAELTLGLILDLLRKISQHNWEMKKGYWKKDMGSLLSGKTLGIIGLGTIGKMLVELTKGFRLEYLAYDLHKDYEYAKKNGIEYCKLNDLLAQSDIVSCHLSLSSDVQHLIDYNALKKMKSSAILINTSRGEVIDEEALVSILDEGQIGGAALDVYQEEPYRGELLKYNNVITTPHIGAYAREIRKRMELEAAENLVKGIKLVR